MYKAGNDATGMGAGGWSEVTEHGINSAYHHLGLLEHHEESSEWFMCLLFAADTSAFFCV